MPGWVHYRAGPETADPSPTDGHTLPLLYLARPTWDEPMVFLFMGNH